VRTEGLSYGMMIAVQLNKQTEFNRIWKWAKLHLQQANGYFAWHADTSGQIISSNPAPDGEEYFASALIFASKRWGDGSGIFDYATEARNLLDALANNGIFNRTYNLVGFGINSVRTDASYVLPSFYEVWACFDATNAQFWRDCYTAGRQFFPKACDMTTMLAPNQSNWDGSPYSGGPNFQSDAWRVVGNIMMDWNLFKADPWQANTFAPRYTAFFKAHTTGSEFSLSGSVLNSGTARGLQAQNALVAFAVPAADGRPFVQTLWDMPIPNGQYRYYDGLLYLLAFLHASGNFHLWF
jgi:oligosaccharide reducing-end xylanase